MQDLLSINISLRDECTRARARIGALEDQSSNRETQIKKLQMMKRRLESLCRYQQDQLKDRATQKPAPNESEDGTEEQVQEGAESTATCVEPECDTACADVLQADATEDTCGCCA